MLFYFEKAAKGFSVAEDRSRALSYCINFFKKAGEGHKFFLLLRTELGVNVLKFKSRCRAFLSLRTELKVHA